MDGFFASIISAAACAAIADYKGRSGGAWFFLGLFVPILSLLLLLVLPCIKTQESEEAAQRTRTRRLEEQLRQERARVHSLESQYADAQRRIDMHDQALGIETRVLDPAPPVDARYLTRDGESWQPA